MFTAHYSASLALKGYEKNLSLGVLFIGAQFLDLVITPLVLLGIERLNVIPNYTASTHFELEYIPYTHGLLAATVWSLVTYLIFRFVFFKNSEHRHRIAVIMALAVASHWVFDFIVHTPDLPLITDNSPKVGLGLWNNAPVSFTLEVMLLIAGLTIYLRSTKSKSKEGKYGMAIFVAFLSLISAYFIFGPPPPFSIEVMSSSLFMLYLTLSGIAFWLDKKRL